MFNDFPEDDFKWLLSAADDIQVNFWEGKKVHFVEYFDFAHLLDMEELIFRLNYHRPELEFYLVEDRIGWALNCTRRVDN